MLQEPMKEEVYPLLQNAPPHDSPEFIEYIRKNNVVVSDFDDWIVIQNCKYYREDRPWLTAFYRWDDGSNCGVWWKHEKIEYLLKEYEDWEWLKKSPDRQTVQRFHIHFYKPQT